MADKFAIHELLARAAYGYDEADLDLLGDCFDRDATMSIVIAQGDTVGPFRGNQAIMQLMRDSLGAQDDQRRHVISNIFFREEKEDEATVVSNLTLTAVKGGQLKVISTGIYRDEVALCHDGQWRIRERFLALDCPY